MKSSGGRTILDTVLEVLVITIVFFAVVLFFGQFLGHGFSPENSSRASARNDSVQIATAIVGYYTEYGRFPSTNAEVQDVDGPILQALLGSNSNLNPRQIVFLEVPAARKGKGGTTNGVYVDPWGFAYKMKLDIEGDKRITNVGPAYALKTVLTNKIVAVWNDPDYHSDRPNEEKRKKRTVNSWE